MEITFSEFKAKLSEHVSAASEGEELLITQKGVPVARLTPVGAADLLTRLKAEGLISPPTEERAVPRLPQAETAKDALSTLMGRLRR